MNPKRHSSRPPPLLPKAFRKRLSPQQLADISLVHHVNLDALLKSDPAILLDFGTTVLTWRNVADRLSLGQEEMQVQVALLERLVEQFRDAGAIVLDARDREIALEGVVVMDMLASEVDIATAAWCVERGNTELQRRLAGSETITAQRTGAP